MRRLLMIACTLVASLVLSKGAVGSTLDCEGIRNADQRNYCRAVTKKQKSWCEFIKSRDLRYRCRAEVK